jgi:hypothetical protein
LGTRFSREKAELLGAYLSSSVKMHRSNRRPKIQMRSGPATRTALFWRNSCFPFSTHEAWAKSTAYLHSEESGHSADSQVFNREANFANQPAALRWPAASPAVCGGLLRRPQRPGNQCAPRRASWRNPPDHSPSRIIRHRWLCRNALAGHAGNLA